MLGAESEAGPLPPAAAKLLDFSALRDAAFIWYSLFGLFATLGFFAPQLYVIELSKSRGVAPATASYMLSAMAVAEFLGRLSIGLLLNRVRHRKTMVLLTCVALLCAVLLAFTAAHDFWGLAVCSALYGFFLGTVASTHIPLLAEEEVVGVQRMASSVGVYVFIQSFAGLAGPPLGGKKFYIPRPPDFQNSKFFPLIFSDRISKLYTAKFPRARGNLSIQDGHT